MLHIFFAELLLNRYHILDYRYLYASIAPSILILLNLLNLLNLQIPCSSSKTPCLGPFSIDYVVRARA